ncbi:MAG TPA: addiction module protein [Spirochaetota bacterium]|nr:addiction module protein [Spirochaetota bacterium]
MIRSLQIAQMTREEKLQAMEALWAHLSQNETDLASPAWHARELRETETRASAGQKNSMD